ncbi:uncharacterized protein LOC119070041 [Bradysia coprophila]|uniref:uncharacterized protein LOC119070041 n=1 Tax=Bradysia coprophila TaxID=38358 RepID=UPI00187D7A72|nr:uncharacterized protein LOC119070041 [Bradysia coprophila]
MYLAANINRLVFVEMLFYSAYFPDDAIRFTSDAICQSSHNIIDIFYVNTTTTTDRFLKLLYSKCPVPVLLNQLGKYIENPEKDTRPSTKVLLINTMEQVDTFMDFIYEFRIGKDKRKYFVIIERHMEPNPDQWLYYLFAKFWRKQILNVVVVFYKESVQIFTYQLFEDCGNSDGSNISPTTTSPNSEQAYHEQEFYLNVLNITSYPTSKWFFNKLTNLQRRKLVVTMISVPNRAYLREDKTFYAGIDGNVAELIRSRMNATFTYISPKFSFNGSNNTGPFGDIVQKRAHFSFNIHAYAPYNFNNTVEQTNAFDHVKFCVIVPRNGMSPVAFNIFHSMTPAIWVLVIVAIVIVTIALASVQYAHKNIRKRINHLTEQHKSYTIVELASIVLQSFFGDAIEQIAFYHHSLRFILLGWLIYSFLITSAFTATIISSLIKPNHRENINTIAELAASKLTILYPKPIAKNIENGFDYHTFQLLEDNFKEINSWEEHLTILNQNKTQYAYVLADYYCSHAVRSNIDKETGESIFHMVPECLSSHPKVYFAQRGSMYLGYVNELLGRFHEYGMFRRWIAESKFFSVMKGLRMGYQAADKEVDYASVKVAMNMEYLQTPFYMLVMGLLLSTIIFCVEKRWYKMVKQKQHDEGGGFEVDIEFELE